MTHNIIYNIFYNITKLTPLQSLLKACSVLMFCALLSGGTHGVAHAQASNTWQLVGLSGVRVNALAIAGDTLYAGSVNGVFRSINNGDSWVQFSDGLVQRNILSLATSGGRVFAGTAGAGLFVSDNSAITWRQSSGAGLASQVLRLVANNNIVINIEALGLVNRSTNSGRTWENAISTVRGSSSLAIVRDAVYVGTSEGGQRSTDNGATWRLIPSLNETPIGDFIEFGGILFCGSGGGTRRSTDNGNTWFRSPGIDLQFSIQKFAICNGVLYAASGSQVYRLRADDTWESFSRGLPGENSLRDEFVIQDLLVVGNQIFAATRVGIYRINALPPVPTLIATPTQLPPSSTIQNTPGAVQTYTLFGQNLTTNVTLSTPPNVTVALSPNGPFVSRLTLPINADGSLPTITLYARLESAVPINVTGEIFHQSGSTSATVRVSGVIREVPIAMQGITVTPDTLDFGTNLVGAVLTPRSYVISGILPNVSELRVVAPTFLTVSLSPTGPFTSFLTIPSNNGRFDNVRVYVLLSTAMRQNPFGNNITHIATGRELPTVFVRGVILEPPFPTLSTTTASIVSSATVNFGRITQNDPLPQQTYTIIGRNLSADVIITAPLALQIFNPFTQTWVNELTLPRDNNRSTTQTITVRPASTANLAPIQGLIVNQTLGATNVNVTVLGNVEPPPLTLTATPNVVNFGTVMFGESKVQQYRLNARNVPVNANLQIAAPTLAANTIEVSTNDTGPFVSTLMLPVQSSSFEMQVFVRFTGLVPDSIRVSPIANAIFSPTATTQATVRLEGFVFQRPQRLSVNPDSIALGTVVQFDPAIPRTYIVTGENLTAPVVVTAPDGVLLWNPSTGAWVRTLTLATSATGSVMQTISARLDSSVIRTLPANAVITHQSGTAQASERVSGAVIPLFLPSGTETSLETRFITARQPMLIGDTARVQIWLRDSRGLSPRLIGRFVRNLFATVRIDTNNLAILGVQDGSGTRARFQANPQVPRISPLTQILIERVDTTSIGNMLLAEMSVMATFGRTTTNTIRLVQPTEWRSTDGTPASTRVSWLPDFLNVEILPIFPPRRRASALTTVIAPNPSVGNVEILYTLSDNIDTAPLPANEVIVEAVVLDVSGQERTRFILGKRRTNTLHRESVQLSGVPTGAYYLQLRTPHETLSGRVDIMR